MLIQMKVGISGSHFDAGGNGRPYPPVGVPTEVEDSFGAQLCAKGLATPVTTHTRAETAVVPPAEQRAEQRRGPGRPRKEQEQE